MSHFTSWCVKVLPIMPDDEEGRFDQDFHIFIIQMSEHHGPAGKGCCSELVIGERSQKECRDLGPLSQNLNNKGSLLALTCGRAILISDRQTLIISSIARMHLRLS